MEDIIFPGEHGGRWNLSHKEATLWVEEMIRCSNSKRGDTMHVQQNLFTDSTTPLILGPPLTTNTISYVTFERLLWDLRWATSSSKYIIPFPDPSRRFFHKIVIVIDKVRDSRSGYCGHGFFINSHRLMNSFSINVRILLQGL